MQKHCLSLIPVFHSSGTEKQHVADDYAKRLHIGQVECEVLIEDVIEGYLSEKSGIKPPKFEFCENLNISICNVTEKCNNVSPIQLYNHMAISQKKSTLSC